MTLPVAGARIQPLANHLIEALARPWDRSAAEAGPASCDIEDTVARLRWPCRGIGHGRAVAINRAGELLRLMQIFGLSAAAMSLAMANAAQAESLAGKVGNKRFPIAVMGSEGGCPKAYKDYVAASGHSAYASTVIARMTEFYVCGTRLNAPSQKIAEQQALRNCEAGLKKYKFETTGRCEVAASK